MVDFSLRKARNNWKQLSSPSKAKDGHDEISRSKSNPYENLDTTSAYNQLPDIDKSSRQKVGTSMQRRLSVHTPKYMAPNFDLIAEPLPKLDASALMDKNGSHHSLRDVKPRTKLRPKTKNYSGNSLKQILSDPNFQAKKFVTANLGNASAVEIEQFTSGLNSLALEVSDDMKENVNKSYNEIMVINSNLSSASRELRNLRSNIKGLQTIMDNFYVMAEKRVLLEKQMQSRNNNDNQSLLPPANASKVRDRTSVFMLEKVWADELAALSKSVEGAQKFISAMPGRHVLMKTGNWFEVNAATLKPLRGVHIFILNDLILIAVKKQEAQRHELALSHCYPLRETVIEGQEGKRISMNYANRTQCLYQTQDPEEFERLFATIRGAKDDLKDISEAEEESAKRIRDSFNYLRSNQTFSGRDGNMSPVKTHGRHTSLGSMSPQTHGTANDQFLYQNITASVQSVADYGKMSENTVQLKKLDEEIEELDITLARRKYEASATKLHILDLSVTKLKEKLGQEDAILTRLLDLKIEQRKQDLLNKLYGIISGETTNLSQVFECLRTMIKLEYADDALELFLQNRSKRIQELILQIGAFDNSTNYLTQIAVIRFQAVRNGVLSVQDLFESRVKDLSSMIVVWCSDEVDKHFALVNKQILNHETIPPSSIKSTRKEIDALKEIGIDFVYKLDDFLRQNNSRIR
ncbi:LAMI_0E09714g1_1 [Lachancea mirantina]|uniref:Exocyst complex component EXO84 n=1 Tax=Lachancea mirantina TaxID=1230905 RepID=A0A1G4JNN6_9SACH|nr:LAMI_0E09714g1_1 [Lachancea mirantina]